MSTIPTLIVEDKNFLILIDQPKTETPAEKKEEEKKVDNPAPTQTTDKPTA